MKLLRRLPLPLLLTTVLCAQSVRFDELPLNAAAGSTTPDLASAQDGSLYVSWIEPLPENAGHALRMAQFDRDADAWSAARTVASGSNWFINGADTPTLAAGLRGKVAAVWYAMGSEHDGHSYHAVFATSEDHGASWSAPAPITVESSFTEFVKVVPLINGKWLALWLDGRGHADGAPMQLRSRLLGSDDSDTMVDERVCDCCSIAASVLPNGAVLVTYRDRSDDEVRDMAFKRYSRGAWTDAASPPGDGWTINACPVNGAELARRGAHVAAAWFTAAGGEPRVMTARSSNIGNAWNLVGTVSDPAQKPIGRVSVEVTRDGSQWISWVESSGALALRRLDRDGIMHDIDRLASPTQGNAGPHARPRLTLLDNRIDQPARLLVVRPEAGRVVTTIATLPRDEGAIVDDCGCGTDTDAERGHALRGRIEAVLKDRNALLVAHDEIPGVMKPMTMSFQVDPRVLPLVHEGQQIMARMERRDDGQWWLFNIRLLNQPN